jgi:hypothetical protein
MGTMEVVPSMVVGEERWRWIWRRRRPSRSGGEGGWSWVEKDGLGWQRDGCGEDGLGVVAL